MEAEVYIHNPKKFTRLEMDADRVNLIAGFSFDEALQQYSLVSLTDKTIELVSDSITLTADKVLINGTTTFDSLFTDGTTTIDGGKITTGTITADELNVSTLSAISSNLGNITGGTISIGNYFNVDIYGNTTIRRGYIADNFTIDQYAIRSGSTTDTYISIYGVANNLDPEIRLQNKVSSTNTEIAVLTSNYISFTDSASSAYVGVDTINHTSSGGTIEIFDGTSGEALYMYIENDDNTQTSTVTIEAETGNITASGDTAIGGALTVSGTTTVAGLGATYLQATNATITNRLTTKDITVTNDITANDITANGSIETTYLKTHAINVNSTNPTILLGGAGTLGISSSTYSQVQSWIFPDSSGTVALTKDLDWTSISSSTVPVDCNEVMFELRYTTSQGQVQRTFTIIPTALLKAVTSSYAQSIYIGDKATLGGRVTYTYSSSSTYFNFSFYTYYEGTSVSGSLLTYYR